MRCFTKRFVHVRYRYLASFGLRTEPNILRWYRYMMAKGYDESGEIIDKLALGRQVREMLKKLEEEQGGKEA